MAAQEALYLGFDFGQKQMGIAVGQSITRTASPVGTLTAKQGQPDWSVVDQLVRQWCPAGFVVGLPLNMDGTLSDMAHRARAFAKQLEHHYPFRPAHCIDERLSTKEAQRWYQDRYQRLPDKTLLDTLAAVIILESFLNRISPQEEA